MMREIEFTGRFKRDYKREMRSDPRPYRYSPAGL